MYEGGLRVPMIVSHPGQLPANKVCDEIVSSLDIYATCVAMLGSQPRDRRGKAQPIEGHDMRRVLSGQSPSEHNTLFWRQGGRAALREGDWKIVAPGRDAANRKWELYNLADDMSETRNFATEQSELLEKLQTKFLQLDQQMAPPLF